MRRWTTVAALALLGLAASAAAQGRQVRFEGRVLWIAGQTMVLDLSGNPGVRIDLSGVPQRDYYGLRAGDHVIVTGVVSDDYSRVNGTAISRISFEGQSP